MDEPEQAAAYAAADFAEVNQSFVDAFRGTFPEFVEGSVIDLGCGPADIPLRLTRALRGVRIVAVDGARSMLRLARIGIARARSGERVDLLAARVPALPLRTHAFDACISNSLLHHLSEPRVFWHSVRSLCRPGAPVFIMDLARPATCTEAREIVLRESGNESALLQRDFYNSLLAAFTVDEVRAQLVEPGLESLSCERVDDRHWRVAGRNPER
jgi:SAM-dependent methyltransferase